MVKTSSAFWVMAYPRFDLSGSSPPREGRSVDRVSSKGSSSSFQTGRVDRHVHVAGEDGKAVIAVIGAGIVPGVHLAEGHAHLLEDVLFLDAGADQIGLNLLDELLELVAGHVVIDQRAVFDVMGGALVVVVMAELVAGADDFHAKIFIGADHVARTQAADEQHDLLPSSRGRYFAMTASISGLIFRDDTLGAFLDLVVEMRGDRAQRLLDLGRSKEVILDPRNAVLLFHMPRDVVHRAVAVQDD